jgi:uncharacterized YccA/Bax inhibitor family protein
MRSTNPVLANAFKEKPLAAEGTMTVQGVIWKTMLSLGLILLSGGFTWMQFAKTGNLQAVNGYMMLGALAGFVLALVTVFKADWSPVTTPLYALAEGLFLGGISAVLEAQLPGIVVQAALSTLGTLFVMLAAYQSGLIRATEKFKLGVLAATGGIALVYLISFVLSFFGIAPSFIYQGGPLGIIFSLIVVAVAALNLIMDFDVIEQGAARGAPKYMEWYGSFALMVTLVWLYVEFLRLLSKVREQR